MKLLHWEKWPRNVQDAFQALDELSDYEAASVVHEFLASRRGVQGVLDKYESTRPSLRGDDC